MATIICGKCKNRHGSVLEVKACYEAKPVQVEGPTTFDYSEKIPTKYDSSNGLTYLVGPAPKAGDSITVMQRTAYYPETKISEYNKVTRVVKQMMYWMDNSVEAIFEDGTKLQLVYPNGDAC